MINEYELRNRLVSCQDNIDAFHADIDQGDIPSFDSFEQKFIQLAKDVQDFTKSNPHSHMHKDFERVLGHFRDLGPKLERSRRSIRRRMESVPAQRHGHTAYAKRAGAGRH